MASGAGAIAAVALWSPACHADIVGCRRRAASVTAYALLTLQLCELTQNIHWTAIAIKNKNNNYTPFMFVRITPLNLLTNSNNRKEKLTTSQLAA